MDLIAAPGRASAIDRVLETARRGLVRVRPEELDHYMASGSLVVDTRPEANRAAEGTLPGALVIERNVLEWRLDPTSPDRITDALEASTHVIVVCNDGYASSLAAESLQRLGLTRATDLEGGFRAWQRLKVASHARWS